MIKNPGLGLFDTVLIQILGRSENLLVTVGGVTAKIYRSDTGGYVSWVVRYFVDGKAKSLRATSLKQARSKATKRALESVSSGAAHVEALTPQQMAAVSMAAAKLREVGVPLLKAVTDFVAARKARGAKRHTKNLLFLDRTEALARWSGPRPVANPGSLTAPFVRDCGLWFRG
jgi:hypothetical protein